MAGKFEGLRRLAMGIPDRKTPESPKDREPISEVRKTPESPVNVPEQSRDSEIPTESFEIGYDPDDETLRGYYNQKEGAFFMVLRSDESEEATKTAEEYRQFVAARLQEGFARISRTQKEKFESKMDAGQIIETGRSKAMDLTQKASIREGADYLKNRTVVQKRAAWLEAGDEKAKQSEQLEIPPIVSAALTEQNTHAENYYGVPLAPLHETQQLPDIHWNLYQSDLPEEKKLQTQEVDPTTLRTQTEQIFGKIFYDLSTKTISEEQACASVKELSQNADFKKARTDLKLWLSEYGKHIFKAVTKTDVPPTVREAIDSLREPILDPNESQTVDSLFSFAKTIANADKNRTVKDELTSEDIQKLKRDERFLKLSKPAIVTLYDRFQRNGMVKSTVAPELLQLRTMHIQAKTDERLTITIVRSGGAMENVGDQIVDKEVQSNKRPKEFVQDKSFDETIQVKEFQNSQTDIPVNPGDVVIFSTKNTNGESPDLNPLIGLDAADPNTSAKDIVKLLQKNGFHGVAMRITEKGPESMR